MSDTFHGPMPPGHRIVTTLDNAGALKGLQRIPEAVEWHVDAEIGAIAEQGAVWMKERLAANRSMARSILANSIRAARLALMHWFVSPGTNYARAVEEGTGPAVGKPNYMPDPKHLEDYVKQRGSIRLRGKPNSPTRRRVLDEIRERAWGLAIHIWWHGTKPQPFVAPTAEKLRTVAPDRVTGAVQRGLQEAFRA